MYNACVLCIYIMLSYESRWVFPLNKTKEKEIFFYWEYYIRMNFIFYTYNLIRPILMIFYLVQSILILFNSLEIFFYWFLLFSFFSWNILYIFWTDAVHNIIQYVFLWAVPFIFLLLISFFSFFLQLTDIWIHRI